MTDEIATRHSVSNAETSTAQPWVVATMQSEQYTSDAICRSMGLCSFIDPSWSCPTLRVLFKPSFHPEVCITLARLPESSWLSVVALTEMLWRQPSPCRLLEVSEEAGLSLADFDLIRADFEAAVDDRDRHGRSVVLDGMNVESCYAVDRGLRQFAENVYSYRPAVRAFVSRLINRAWECCQLAQMRNALAACARYVGDDYPSEPEPPVAPGTRILVLGTPENRAEFFQQLRDAGGCG